VSGNSPEFIITANELRTAKADEAFRLVVVVNALASVPKMHEFTGYGLVTQYDFNPLAYRAVQK
jgi:hypothetical protein